MHTGSHGKPRGASLRGQHIADQDAASRPPRLARPAPGPYPTRAREVRADSTLGCPPYYSRMPPTLGFSRGGVSGGSPYLGGFHSSQTRSWARGWAETRKVSVEKLAATRGRAPNTIREPELLAARRVHAPQASHYSLMNINSFKISF